MSQEVVTDNAQYYTVKLSVLETEASGYEHNQFYTIDKQTGNVVALADLFAEGSDYISVISENIKTQMREQMVADEDVIYFLDDEDMTEFNFQSITEQTNFYFNESGELVIAFDEYEVAPGYMGAPEFVIPQKVTAGLLKETKEYLKGKTPAYHETKRYAGVFYAIDRVGCGSRWCEPGGHI